MNGISVLAVASFEGTITAYAYPNSKHGYEQIIVDPDQPIAALDGRQFKSKEELEQAVTQAQGQGQGQAQAPAGPGGGTPQGGGTGLPPVQESKDKKKVVNEALTDSPFPGYEEEIEPRYRANVEKIQTHPDLPKHKGLYHNEDTKGIFAFQFPFTSGVNIQMFKPAGTFGPRLNKERSILYLDPSWDVERSYGSLQVASDASADRMISNVVNAPGLDTVCKELEQRMEDQGIIILDVEEYKKKLNRFYKSRMGAKHMRRKAIEIPVRALDSATV